MAITRATLDLIKDHGYPPELIPSAEEVSPTQGNEANIMEIKKIPPGQLTQIHNIWADRNDDADLRIKANTHEVTCRAAGIPDWATPTLFDLLCHESSRIAVFARNDLTNYPVAHGFYVWKATVADKLALGMKLTPFESEVNNKLGVKKTLERGTLPIGMDRYFMYEYWPIYRETKCVRETVPTTGIEVDTLRPIQHRDTFVALEAISSFNTAAASNVRMTICRDDDGDQGDPFLTINFDALKNDWHLPMFIPAMQEIRLRVEADVNTANHEFWYTYTHYRLNNILRMRFGLTPREDNPDLYDKVTAGIA